MSCFDGADVEASASAARAVPASFRDPAGRLFLHQERLIRIPHTSEDARTLRAFLETELAREAQARGDLVRTRELPGGAAALGLAGCDAPAFEHDPVAFPSYPYEWPSEMLHAAGRLTLDLAAGAARAGFEMKDATPYNVLFRGPDPVFVDLLSFVRAAPGLSVWPAFGQFSRTFLLPLLVERTLQIPSHQSLAQARDGLEPDAVYRMIGPVRRLLPPFLGLVSTPTWMGHRHARLHRPPPTPAAIDPERAAFVLSMLHRSAARALHRVRPRPVRPSRWVDYPQHPVAGPRATHRKYELVDRFLAEHRPTRVLDLGCNTGDASLMAAHHGASVVAVDSDPVVVGALWQRARREGADVLPLVMDVARPSPGIGWCNQECAGFLDRARGRFDAVLMLALVHHLRVTERVPMDQIVAFTAQLASEYAVIEFVCPEDPGFRMIRSARDDDLRDVSRESFETSVRSRFDILYSERLGESHRWLYMLRKSRPDVTPCRT